MLKKKTKHLKNITFDWNDKEKADRVFYLEHIHLENAGQYITMSKRGAKALYNFLKEVFGD